MGRGEDGTTLVELIVTTSLLGVAVAVLGGLLVSVQSALVRQTSRSSSNDQARLAVEQLDREIRSGNVLKNPTNGYVCNFLNPPANCATTDSANSITPGQSLLIYTQANAPTRQATGVPGERCVQWRIANNSARGYQELQRREWTVNATSPSAWRVVADHVVNQSGTSPAFSIDALGRIVNVSLLVNQDATQGANVRVDLSVEGRNTVYNLSSSSTLCLNSGTSFTSQ
jgi:hypothetical protein